MKHFYLRIIMFLMFAVSETSVFAYDALIDGIYYNFNKNTNTATVTYYKNTINGNVNAYTGDIVIPSSVTCGNTTYSVTSIGNMAFCYCKNITSVSIPSSVLSIESSAFLECFGLTRAEFSSLEHLCSISFKSGNANPLCYAHHLYINGKEITDIFIPNGITSIGSNTFFSCSNINTLYIPNTVQTIDESSFSYCDINAVKVEDGNPTYDSRNDCNAIIETATNKLVRGSRKTVIPEDVTALGNYAFSGCSLTAITIPDNIVSFGVHIFNSCTELTSITIPKNMTNIPTGAFANCSGLTSVTIPNTVSTIGNSAFNSCSITSLTIPISVRKIEDFAFKACTGLTSLTIPENVISIATAAFENCSNLTKVILENRGGSIGAGAFRNCSNLTTLFVLGSPTFYNVPLGNTAHSFHNCNAITQVISFSTKTFYLPDITTGTRRIMLVPASQVKPSGSTIYKPIVNDETTQTTATLSTVSEFSLTAANDISAENGIVTVTGLRTNFLSSVKVTGEVWGETVSGYLQIQTKPITATITANVTASSILLTGSYENAESEVLTAGFIENRDTIVKLNGLDPQTTSKHTYSITTKDGGVSTTDIEIATLPLALTTQKPKVINVGNVIVAAETNIDDEETNVGFEWRRTDWTDDFESSTGTAYLYEGTMEGYIRNLYAEKLWKYRPYYESASGNRYYGEWVGIDPTNTSYFEPTVHTYSEIEVDGNTVKVKGYVMRGTDKIDQQGFYYWKSADEARSIRYSNTITVPENAKKVVASGNIMTAEIKGLDFNSEYCIVAFVKTDENEMFYGEKQQFMCSCLSGDANDDGVVDVADVVAIVNYILEKPAENFNKAAADVNGDEVIDAADVVGVVNIILDKGNVNAARVREVLRKNGFIF